MQTVIHALTPSQKKKTYSAILSFYFLTEKRGRILTKIEKRKKKARILFIKKNRITNLRK